MMGIGWEIPAGKHRKSYRQISIFIGKSTVNGPWASIAMLNYWRVTVEQGVNVSATFRLFGSDMRDWQKKWHFNGK